ncbi:M18 family aminopeptidase [Corynebacterium sp. HS2168-gen11]|uniref:M18 family aminopeptidase n=1 Tax=Corynebacterium sp. HS2168-gen11 TaxID=2974027 RepID=UPI00216B14C2|nr:M18 family aminopeptidase [Corynebacterium sp. HS2168-gen11]MCS4535085.1 M18 family aminopeptidase [Corynebacterium sp. HS2168-gen11]
MIQNFIDYLAQSPSSYHAAHAGAALLAANGFQAQHEDQPWDATPGGHYMIKNGALLAWYIPTTLQHLSSFRIIGAHTDSPGFKLKFNGDRTGAGFQQAGVEVYGGPILPSWFDRELSLAGSLALADGTTALVHTESLLRIPHLAIHLDRSANDTFSIDRQRHLQPIFAVNNPETSILEIVAAAAGVQPGDILAHDLITVPTEPAQTFGHKQEFLAAARLDNLSSVYPGLQAMIQAKHTYESQNIDSNDCLVLACFDHEEVGSASATGAGGPLLENLLTRTATALGATSDELHQIFARSSCVSADAAHSIHPNYPDRHDSENFPLLGQGPALKINANQRYASTAQTEALWIQACRRAGVETQVFVGNNAVPCGSTIGPISSTRLGIETVDVGIPLLSMHSAREMCHVSDLVAFTACLHSYLVA